MDMDKLSRRQQPYIVEYIPLPNTDSDDCVEPLEKILDAAKKGEVVGVAVAAALADGSVRTCWHSGRRWSAVVGAVSHLAFRLHDECR